MRRKLGRTLALILTPALCVAAVLALVLHPHAPPARSALEWTGLPPPPPPGFVVPAPHELAALRGASRWASVRSPVLARAAPNPRAHPVSAVSTRTPEGTTNILELLGQARAARTGLWQRVRLAVLPNGTSAWVPRSALGGSVVLDTHLLVDRSRLRMTLFRGGKRVFSAPVGVGQPQSPTPPGEFYVRDVLSRYRSATYGPIAFGTSARSPTLTDWPAGGYVGIHGTDQPNLVPGRISHGCIRLRNADILRLAALMPVGTPITVQ
jgi:L,D-transpeptidase catalytic domain